MDRMTLDEIGAQARRAKQVLERARKVMLAPHSRKAPPKMSATQLAAMLDMEPRQVDYRAKKGDLPSGRLSEKGYRREFLLPEVRIWMRHFMEPRMRPKGALGVTLAVANFKGGVTKTTTTITLAQGLSRRGHKCLVIDLDAQASLTTLFGILPDTDVLPEQTLLSLFLGDQSSVEYAIQPTYWDGIDLIPATSVLYSAEFALPGRQSKESCSGFKFWKVLKTALAQAREDYDVILIDCPPSLSYTTINGMLAADALLMPLPPNALDFASSVQFWDLFHDLASELSADGNDPLYAFIGVLMSKVDSMDTATSAVRDWISTAYGTNVLPVEIPKTATAAMASTEFGSVYDLASTGSSASTRTLKRALDAYEQLILIIEDRLRAIWWRQCQKGDQEHGEEAA